MIVLFVVSVKNHHSNNLMEATKLIARADRIKSVDNFTAGFGPDTTTYRLKCVITQRILIVF